MSPVLSIIILMEFLYYSAYLGVLVWIVAALRQFKGKYFFFFLFWVSADILTLIARLAFHSGTNFFYVPFSFLAYIGLLDFRYIKKYWVILVILFLVVCTISLKYNLITICVIIIHFIILLEFLKEFIIPFIRNNVISIFILVLIFYEITLVAKYLNYLTGFTNGYYYFIITTFFEIAFGIFFIIFKADNKRLIFQFE